MESIRLKSKVGADGILTLQVPTGLGNTKLEIILILQPVHTISTQPIIDVLGWPSGFFEQTYGAFRDAPLERVEQGDYEQREGLV